MIRTKFGTIVAKVVGGDIDKGEIDVILKDSDEVFRGYIEEFKADNGYGEIREAIQKATELEETRNRA